MYAAPTLSTLLLLLLISTFFSSSYAACNKQDEAALLAFKNSFLHTSLDWSQSVDCCTWDHVGCDNATGRVIFLFFENVKGIPESIVLNGSIPSSVGDLSSLETLRFIQIASLQGPIPPQLSKLKKLQFLQIDVTQVSGPVPSFLSQLTSLEILVLSNNRFSGAIPPSLGVLTDLTYIDFCGNQLTGPIPASFISKLANGSLNTLALSKNKLTGTIPPSLGDLAQLTDIYLSGNQLTGPIPASLFSKLPKGLHTILVLSENKLTGTIPRPFANVPFAELDLQHNNLNGDASFLFGKSKPSININLANNSLAFDLSKTEFPLNMGFMDISHNQIYGSIPNQITELPNLSYVDVSFNQLCGKIPTVLAQNWIRKSSYTLSARKKHTHSKGKGTQEEERMLLIVILDAF